MRNYTPATGKVSGRLRPDMPNRIKNEKDPDKAIAYCHNNMHRGYLGPEHISEHGCIAKECKFLERYNEKTYWARREISNVLKKYNKDFGAGYIQIEDKTAKTDNMETLLSIYMSEYSKVGEPPLIKYVKGEDAGLALLEKALSG